MKPKILVVDDEPDALELIEVNLKAAGYDVVKAADGADALLKARKTMPALILLAACAERQSLPNDPTGRLFARGLDEITDLYIAPVSNRKLILAGAARLSRLDGKFSVTESVGSENKTQIALSYGGREVAVYPMPLVNSSPFSRRMDIISPQITV